MALSRVGDLDAWVDPDRVSLVIVKRHPETVTEPADDASEYELKLVVDGAVVFVTAQPHELPMWLATLRAG